MSKRTEADRSRQLTEAQELALASLLSGSSDAEAAQAAGVTRQTVNGWRNECAPFMAELQARRLSLWEAQQDRLRKLLGGAVDVLESELTQEGDTLEARRARLAAAVHVLRASGLYGASLAPAGSLSVEEIETRQAVQKAELSEQRLMSSLSL